MNDEVFEEKLKKAFQQEIEVPDSFKRTIETALNEENIRKYEIKRRKEKLKTILISFSIIVVIAGILYVLLWYS